MVLHEVPEEVVTVPAEVGHDCLAQQADQRVAGVLWPAGVLGSQGYQHKVEQGMEQGMEEGV